MPFARLLPADRLQLLELPPMKTASICLCAAAFIFASISCDSHSWEETKVLHEGMHKHEGHAEEHGHADAHGEKKEEAGHGEKKEEAKHH